MDQYCAELFADLKRLREALGGSPDHEDSGDDSEDVDDAYGCYRDVGPEARCDQGEPSSRRHDTADTATISGVDFGKSAVEPSVHVCLRLNEECQILVVEAIERLLTNLQTNRDKQIILQRRTKKRGKSKAKVLKVHTGPLVIFTSPYFKDINRMPAPLNEDAIAKKERREMDPYLRPPSAWDASGVSALELAVRGNLIGRIIELTLEKRELLTSKKANLQPSVETSQETETLGKMVCRLEKLPIDELLDLAGGRIDWLRISAIDFESNRSTASCELTWRNMVCKGNAPWSDEDDSRLLEIVGNRGALDWDTVAHLVGKDRTPFQCAQRFHEKFRSKIKWGKFTPQEDQHLLLLVSRFHDGHKIPWRQVAYHMEGRKRSQVIRRWETALDPMIRRGPWSKEEDTLLVAAVEAHGQHWVRIADFVPGRNANQCRDRYMNAFAGNVTFGHWSPEEDCKLIELVKKHGPGKWAQISEDMACRSRNMVLMRYKRLQKKHSCHNPEALEQLVKERRWKGRKTVRTSETRKRDIVTEIDSATLQEVGGGVTSRMKCSLMYESHLQKRLTEPSDDEEPTSVPVNVTTRNRVARRSSSE